MVINGVTGYRFCPTDISNLAGIFELATQEKLMARLGVNAQQHIEEWSPAAFAVGLAWACHQALSAVPKYCSVLSQLHRNALLLFAQLNFFSDIFRQYSNKYLQCAFKGSCTQKFRHAGKILPRSKYD